MPTYGYVQYIASKLRRRRRAPERRDEKRKKKPVRREVQEKKEWKAKGKVYITKI